MEKVRFDLQLPVAQRRELAALAAEIGMSSADVVRLSLKYMLERRELFLRPINEKKWRGTMNGIGVRELRLFLNAATAAVENPGTAAKLLALAERAEKCDGAVSPRAS
jgi:hypothetical protein